MSEARYFCPDCGSIDLVVAASAVLSVAGGSGSTAQCPNCEWSGALSETIGAVSSEQFWDAERVGRVLLRVVQKRAAGPLVQVLEFVGILPRFKTVDSELSEKDKTGLVAYNTMVQNCRDHVMREMFAASITAGFEAAEEAHRIYAVETNTPLHQLFRTQEPS